MQFRDSYNAILGHKTFFYHHGADIVPWIPGWLMGNRHVGHRLWWTDYRFTWTEEPTTDPPLFELAANLGMLLWRRRAIGFEALLADHRVSTYQALLTWPTL